MDKARRVVANLSFNGKNVDTTLADYLKSVKYVDVASGESDEIEIGLQNVTMKWLKSWYPKKGDKIKGNISFRHWKKAGVNIKLACGSFVLDQIRYRGGPLEATFGGLAIPASESFKTRERTKTWKKVTIQQIGKTIAKRYSLKLVYDASKITIAAIEQSEKTDSAFLYELTKKYGLGMKVYNNKIVIFDKGKYEKKKVVATIDRTDFVDDEWEYEDTLQGTYTGARFSYKSGKNSKEISAFIGLKKENAKGSRVLKVSEQADSLTEGKYIAAAKVNEANEGATVLTGSIFPNPKIVASATVNVTGMGKANGKYFVDKVTTQVTDKKTTMQVELHKCQARLTYTPKASTGSGGAKKNYKVGDIVNFKGGTHYVSSYPGSKGYSVKAGKAKITIANGSGKAHPWHLVTQNWSQTHVWGWVDDGTFS